MRIFLDANLLFSASKSNGAIRRLLQFLADQDHNLIASLYVVEEARRNLRLKYPAAMQEFDALLATLAEIGGIATAPDAPIADLAETDQPVLNAAIAMRCDVLVTGDTTHFAYLFGERVAGLAIVSPRSLGELVGFV